MADSANSRSYRDRFTKFTASGQFVFDLVEFWIAGVIGLAIFGSIIVTVVHGGMPWECEEHISLVSGSRNSHWNTSHLECEYLTSTGWYSGTHGTTTPGDRNEPGMIGGGTIAMKETICNAHGKSLGCLWLKDDAALKTFEATHNVDVGDVAENSADECRKSLTQTQVSENSDGESDENYIPHERVFDSDNGCCLYAPPTQDDQLHDICYSIDQYVKDEHYPNFVGDYLKKVKAAKLYAILGYAFGFAAFSARLVYHIPFLTSGVGDGQRRDDYARLADTAFCIAAFIFTVLMFMKLDDVLIDNRKHLWGEGGIFKDKSHSDAVEKMITPATGFYATAVYATFLGINSVWFLGTTFKLIPVPSAHRDEQTLRGPAFRSEYA